jgi:hypothetical protein
MSGMRVIWLVGALLVGAAAMLLLTDHRTPPGEARTTATALDAPRAAEPVPGAPAAAATTTPAPPAAGMSAPAGTSALADAPRPARVPVVREPGAVDTGLDRKIAGSTVVAGNIVPKTDARTGERLLYADGRYEIRGDGTKESPYRVSWECLASASETYVPRLNEHDMPQRVALLDGAWVQVEGYLAFPLMVSETKELLVMLNQWDGCCIGVPPTPYDAIEVKLLEPAKRSGAHATFNFGGVKGRLRVDPYLIENWLVGLYVLEDAAMVEGARPEL